ncbi:MAG: YcxB family protein [Cytophagales bacterium]|nr:MAG: YcxB family protein [Cytophagales bacterium]
MIVKTKRYAIDQKTYINVALKQWLRDNWKYIFIPIALIFVNAILGLTGIYPNIWIYVTIFVLTILYVLFWAIQITGISQMEQSKPLFEKYIYEIDSRQILMRINAKEGGLLKWEQIKAVEKSKDAYIFFLDNEPAMRGIKANWFAKFVTRGLAKAQFLYLPYTIFNSEHDQKFLETILRRKELILEAGK